MTKRTNYGLALLLAGALALGGVSNAGAGPLPINAAAMKSAVSSDVIDVRYRHRGGAIAAGMAFGIIGAIIASQRYAYPQPYYYEPYAPAYYPPAYYPPAYYQPPAYYEGPAYYEAPAYYYGPPAVYYGHPRVYRGGARFAPGVRGVYRHSGARAVGTHRGRR